MRSFVFWGEGTHQAKGLGLFTMTAVRWGLSLRRVWKSVIACCTDASVGATIVAPPYVRERVLDCQQKKQKKKGDIYVHTELIISEKYTPPAIASFQPT